MMLDEARGQEKSPTGRLPISTGVIVAMITLLTGITAAEPPRVRDYTPSTLAGILPASGAADDRVELLRQDARYLAKVHYAGRSRPVGADKRAAMEQWIQARHMKPEVMTILGTEYAFRESGREYWIPVLDLGNGIVSTAPDTPVTLLLHHAGRIGSEPLLVAVVAAPGWELRDKALEMDARRERHESTRSLIESLRRCAEAWRKTHPQSGYPPSLAQMGPQGDGCLDASALDGSPFNYRLRYLAGPPDVSGAVRVYSICAQPTDFPATRAVTYIGDEEGIFPPMEPSPGDRPTGCGQAWGPGGYHITARQVKYCLIEYAAANPAEGFPRDLKALSTEGSGCLSANFRPDSSGAIEAPFDRLRYSPKARAKGGTAHGFELRIQSRTSPANFLFMDESGVIRTAYARDARPGDPTLEEESERHGRDMARALAEVDRFRAGCESGRMTDCLEAGFRYFLVNDGRALEIWENACAAGIKEACLLAKSRPFQYEIFEWTFNLRRLCFRGDADGCRRLEEYVARTDLKPKP